MMQFEMFLSRLRCLTSRRIAREMIFFCEPVVAKVTSSLGATRHLAISFSRSCSVKRKFISATSVHLLLDVARDDSRGQMDSSAND